MASTKHTGTAKRSGRVGAAASSPFAPSPAEATAVGQLRQPQGATPHFLPRDLTLESGVDRVEKLLRRGRFEAALRQVAEIETGDGTLDSAYALMLEHQATRANLGRGDRHLHRGETKLAQTAYAEALRASVDHPAVSAVHELTTKAFDRLRQDRSKLIEQMLQMVTKANYEKWCATCSRTVDSSILNVSVTDLVSDVAFEDVYGPVRPGGFPPAPAPGWLSTPRPDSDLAGVIVDRPALAPGLRFEASTRQPLLLSDLIAEFTANGDPVSRADHRSTGRGKGRAAQVLAQVGVSAAMPLMTSYATAFARLHGLQHNLDLLGVAPGSTPLLRYRYLREQADRILDHLDTVDQRMLSAQFKLDDFAELIETVRRQLNQQGAELQAVTAKIAELQAALTTLKQGEEQIGQAVQRLEKAEDDCDPEWWEVLVSVLVVIGAVAIGAVVGFFLGGPVGAVAGGVVALITSIGLTIQVWSDREITCENVSQARQDFQRAHQDIKTAVADVRAELEHSLLTRDALIAELASLQYTFDEAVAANEARVLNAATLGRVLSTLDSVRQSQLLRAHNLAAMAQSAYNFENDASVNVVRDSYLDYLEAGAKGYTAAALLRRDLSGLDHIRQTSRVRKQIQLTQEVSLRKHQPMAFAAVLMSGGARFSTRMADFDRWYPGTYLQRLREVRVEVHTADGVSPVRGYLTNGGVSYVRFLDVGNHVEIDGRDVFAEPDPELAKLCYKRRRRHHAVETMAFPQMAGALADARDVDRQSEERNHFENCGLESVWSLELLPDQAIEFAKITDIRLVFQYDAHFDANLRRVTEAKRHTGRHETAMVSARQVTTELGGAFDPAGTVTVPVSAYSFEAPQVPKIIEKVGLFIRPRGTPLLAGVAGVRLSYNGDGPIEVRTNEMGVVATALDRPAGDNTAALESMVVGKSVVGEWRVELTDLPEGMSADEVDDVLLMVNYAYAPAS